MVDANNDDKRRDGCTERVDPFKIPKEMGILATIDSSVDLRVFDIVQRIQVGSFHIHYKLIPCQYHANTVIIP